MNYVIVKNFNLTSLDMGGKRSPDFQNSSKNYFTSIPSDYFRVAIFAKFRTLIFFWKSWFFLLLCAENFNFFMIKLLIPHVFTIKTRCGAPDKIETMMRMVMRSNPVPTLFFSFQLKNILRCNLKFLTCLSPHVQTVLTSLMSRLVKDLIVFYL